MDDDLLVAAAKPQIAVGVGPHHVAGVEPLLANDFGACAGVVPIAGGTRRRAHEEAPFRPARDFAPVFAANENTNPGLGIPIEPSLSTTVGGCARQSRFGHAVAFADGVAG